MKVKEVLMEEILDLNCFSAEVGEYDPKELVTVFEDGAINDYNGNQIVNPSRSAAENPEWIQLFSDVEDLCPWLTS